MKNIILSLFSLIFLSSCQNTTIRAEENITVDSNKINIKYINFMPTKVDSKCMKENIAKLFYAIDNNGISIYTAIFSMEHENYKELSSKSGLIIENIEENRFILMPIDSNQFFLSQKPFDNKNDEVFSMYELKNKIDFKKCLEN
jgi:hypothetical protein